MVLPRVAKDQKIEKIRYTTLYLRSLFVSIGKECISWELRCALVESQTKTKLVTVNVDQMTACVVGACKIEKISHTTFYLRPLFVTNCRNGIPRKFLSPLLENQLKVDQSFNYDTATSSQGPPVHNCNLKQNKLHRKSKK
ncbi:hypothetical protein V1478_002282 [Vespula squamosa]|uniref:Uncharacterized protein n=1 Tax=Vespula squamosa TaxID=30214 RepID=A0ABD2BVU0_VESSQ